MTIPMLTASDAKNMRVEKDRILSMGSNFSNSVEFANFVILQAVLDGKREITIHGTFTPEVAAHLSNSGFKVKTTTYVNKASKNVIKF